MSTDFNGLLQLFEIENIRRRLCSDSHVMFVRARWQRRREWTLTAEYSLATASPRRPRRDIIIIIIFVLASAPPARSHKFVVLIDPRTSGNG